MVSKLHPERARSEISLHVDTFSGRGLAIPFLLFSRPLLSPVISLSSASVTNPRAADTKGAKTTDTKRERPGERERRVLG